MNWFYKIAHLSRKYEPHIKNILYFLITRLTAILAFVIVVPFFIHNASAEQYGLASIGFSLLTISTALDVAFGYVFVQSLGRRYARGKSIESSPAIKIFTFYINISTGIAAIGIVIALNLGLTFSETLMYTSLAAALPALCISGCAASIFQARNQLKPINLSRFSFELSKALALAISGLIYNDISLIGPVILIAAYLRCGFDLFFVRKITNINFKYRLHSLKDYQKQIKLIGYGSHPLLISALTIPITIGDKIIIKKLFGAESVALYSLAFDISTKAYILVYAVNAAMLSVILHHHAIKNNTKSPLLVGLCSVTFLSIFFYIPLFIFASEIIGYWLPEMPSSEIVPLIRIMSLSSVIYLYGNVFEVSLTAMGRAKSVFFVYLIGVVFYWFAISVSSWSQVFHGFMYSYLLLTIILLSGFSFYYFKLRKVCKTSPLARVMHD